MAKIRIHELAKELIENKIVNDSKTLNSEIVALLTKKGVEVKNHMSSVESDDADYVRNYFSGNSKAAKEEKPDKKSEAKNEEKNMNSDTKKNEAKSSKSVEKIEKKNESEQDSKAAAENRPEVKKESNNENKPDMNGNRKNDSETSNSKSQDAPKAEQKKSDDTRKHAPVGKLVNANDGSVTEYWVAKDGRLVGMDGRALPFERTPDGRIQRLNGRPIKKKDVPDKKTFDNGQKPADRQPVQNTSKPAEEKKDDSVQTPSASENQEVKSDDTVKTENKLNTTAPSPKIVGNIFDSLNAAKKQEAAARERRAQQQAAGGRQGDGRRDDYRNRDNRNGDYRNNDGKNGNRYDNRGDRPAHQFGQRDNRNGNVEDRGNRPYNRDGQARDFGNRDSQGARPFGDRQQRPFGDRNNQAGGRPQGNRFQGGPAGFGDKDKDDDTRRQFPSKKVQKPSAESTLKNELGSQLNKNDRAGKFKNKGKDKKDKRDYDEESIDLKKKDPNRKGAFQKPVKVVEEVKDDDIKTIVIPEVITIKDLADKMKQNAGAIVKKLFLAGKMINQNSEITYEEAEEIALDYEIICEKEVKVNIVEELLKDTDEDPETLVKRPPVVCVMGHVDHGKTSLLDAIRSTNVTSREAGGITQAIGAYMVEINGQKITFLDTPGHEAFTSMRMRGAKSTDIAILVVAADDGVMPQTIEAINHAKAANVQIIVAVNKIDKPGANIERVKQELTEYGLVAEDWGGDTVFVPVSAKTHEGIENLLEMVILTADVLELKANPNRKARGIVIEAERDRGKGCIATVLVQKGTLNVGDYVAIGATHGRIRAMIDDNGRRVRTATPSTPVEIQGLDEVPNAGEIMISVQDEKEARTIAEAFIVQDKEKLIAETKARLSLDGLFSQIQAGNVKELNLIIKADVMGSVEAVKQSLEKLSNEEVVVRVIHGGVGNINESDVNLAGASNAIIIGFNVKPDNTAKDIAEHEGVEIKLYKVIYNAIEDIEEAMKGMYKPVYEEKVIGHAEVRQLFKASGVGIIAGSFVLDGKVERGCSARITREGTQIFDGALASLKRFKDDVKEVNAGYECGLVFEKFTDLAELDQVEFYAMVEVPRK